MSERPGEIYLLIDAVCDGRATEAETERLWSLMRSDESIQRMYVEYMTTHAELQWQMRDADAEQETEAAVVEPVSSARSGGFRIGPLAYALAATLMLAGAAAAIYAIIVSGPASTTRERVAGPPVAVLLEAEDVEWDTQYREVGADLPRERYAIRRGTLEMQTLDGASVRLTGPAEVELISADRIGLRHGKLRVRKDGGGFRVDLPGEAWVTDLGTEFTIDIETDGRSVVRVSEGVIKIDHADPDTESPLTLAAGGICWLERKDADDDGVLRIVRVIEQSDPLADYRFEHGSDASTAKADGVTAWPFGAPVGAEAYAGVSKSTASAFVRSTGTPGDEAASLAGDGYVRFNVTADPGRTIDLAELVIRFGSSGVKPNPWSQTLLVQSSVGGFGPAAPVVARVERVMHEGFSPDGYTLVYDDPHSIDLASADFAGLESIEFRFYFVDGIDDGQAIHRLGNVRLVGSVTPVTPETSTPDPEPNAGNTQSNPGPDQQ